MSRRGFGFPVIGVAALALVSWALTGCVPTSNTGQKNGKACMQKRDLVSVGPGECDKVIEVGVADMLQLTPFRYPLIPKFLEVKLKVELKGDRVLEPIGQTSTLPARFTTEGRGGRSIFLYVQAEGKTTVDLTLVGDDDAPIGERYKATYTVEAKPYRAPTP